MENNNQLAAAYKAGDKGALFKLWNNNQGLIQRIALRFAPYAELEDLIQESYFGLLKAAETYDAERSAEFMAFAGFCIQWTLSRYIEESCSAFRYPRGTRSKAAKVQKAAAAFEQTRGREATDAELAAILNMDAADVKRMKYAAELETIASLDVRLKALEDTTLGESIPDGRNMEDEILERVTEEELRTAIQQEVERLTARQQDALRARYWERVPKLSPGRRAALQASMERLRRPAVKKKLAPFLEAAHYAGRHIGLAEFNRTHTSEPERAAILAESARARYAEKVVK